MFIITDTSPEGIRKALIMACEREIDNWVARAKVATIQKDKYAFDQAKVAMEQFKDLIAAVKFGKPV